MTSIPGREGRHEGTEEGWREGKLQLGLMYEGGIHESIKNQNFR